MANIIAFCGHEIDDTWNADSRSKIYVKHIDRNGARGVVHLVVCHACRVEYAERGEILRDDAEIAIWNSSND